MSPAADLFFFVPDLHYFILPYELGDVGTIPQAW
jgi:hypothetical protein